MTTILFVILGFLVLISAMFSGLEIAYFSLGQVELAEIDKLKTPNQRILLKLLKNKEKLLSTILIGNNLVNIGASALNTKLAIYYAESLPLSEEITITIFTFCLIFVILIFGEIFPKSLALIHNKSLSLFFAPFMFTLVFLLTPVSFIFHSMSEYLNKVFQKTKKDSTSSQSTVIHLLTQGEKLGEITKTEKKLIQNVFIFDDRKVSSIMTPRTSVFALNEEDRIEKVVDQILEEGYSRIPIFSGTVDNIQGVIHVRQILTELYKGNKKKKLKALKKEPFFIYETMAIPSLLEQLKEKRIHLAIIVNEFGGMSGIVTMEDVLEELVGEIFDETDEVVYDIRKVGTHKWLIRGRVDIISINKEIEGEIEQNENYDTLQGLIMNNLDNIPEIGDEVHLGNHCFKVKTMEKNEIKTVLVEYIESIENNE